MGVRINSKEIALARALELPAHPGSAGWMLPGLKASLRGGGQAGCSEEGMRREAAQKGLGRRGWAGESEKGR